MSACVPPRLSTTSCDTLPVCLLREFVCPEPWWANGAGALRVVPLPALTVAARCVISVARALGMGKKSVCLAFGFIPRAGGCHTTPPLWCIESTVHGDSVADGVGGCRYLLDAVPEGLKSFQVDPTEHQVEQMWESVKHLLYANVTSADGTTDGTKHKKKVEAQSVYTA